VIWGGYEDYQASYFSLSNPANFTNPVGWDEAEAANQSGFTPPRITPVVLNGLSVAGDPNDEQGNPDSWNDTLYGAAGTDWIFGGGGRDQIFGGPASDYLDGGDERDEIFGEGGNDIVRGGANDDVVHGDYQYDAGSARYGTEKFYGNEGIDQVYGDGGTDFLFGDWAPAIAYDPAKPAIKTVGQRLWGGEGIDFVYAFAAITLNSPGADLVNEYNLLGDEVHGGPGGDWLYGNLRRDTIYGEEGNEFIHGDYLAGPYLAKNPDANVKGGADRLFGGSDEDQLLGGGGDDELWGGANSDWLEGQKGNDKLYGGGWNDILVLDTRKEYFDEGAPQEVFDGYFGDDPGTVLKDDATDILLIEGTSQNDTIKLGQLDDGRLHVNTGRLNRVPGSLNSEKYWPPGARTRSAR
jgi:Ca2+-binding RTX toxin-like protein